MVEENVMRENFVTIYMPIRVLKDIKKLMHGRHKAYYKVIELLIEERCFDVYNGERVDRYA